MHHATAKRLARAIAAQLFKSGLDHSRPADRLVLTIDPVGDRPGRDLGGWGRGPAEDVIARVLLQESR
jgi:hypothetical protein